MKLAYLGGTGKRVWLCAGIFIAVTAIVAVISSTTLSELQAGTFYLIPIVFGPYFAVWALWWAYRPKSGEVKADEPGQAPEGAQRGDPIGRISLWASIAGLVLPVVLVLVIGLLAGVLKRNLSDGYLLLCWALGIVLQLAALGCGMVARRTSTGKAALIIGSISLLLYVAVYLAAFAKSESSSPRSGPVVESGATQSQTVTTLKFFTVSDRTVSKDLVVDGDAWMANCTEPRTIQLFELPNPDAEDCTVNYRAQLKTEGLKGRAYLEMWCRLPGRGEFFSRGLDHVATGSTDWSSYETPFFLKKGEKPDLIRLNLVVEGTGRVGIRSVEVRKITEKSPSVSASPPAPESKAELSPADAKLLIPEAASMPNAEFDKLASGAEANPAKFDSQTLALILLSLNPDEAGNKNTAALDDFRFLGAPMPPRLAATMWKSKPKGYATAIQPELITDCKCSTENDTATGTVSFWAEKLYSGKVEFVARRREGSWRIDEFRLPGYGIQTIRGSDGKWRKSDLRSKGK